MPSWDIIDPLAGRRNAYPSPLNDAWVGIIRYLVRYNNLIWPRNPLPIAQADYLTGDQ